MYYVLFAVQCLYGWRDEGGEDGNRKEGSEVPGGGGESGDCLASCLEMTCFYVASRRRT